MSSVNSSKFGSTFAPYTPPPDDLARSSPGPSTPKATRTPVRPWFQSQATPIDSYQSGALPTVNSAWSGGSRESEELEGHANQWETRFGMRVDALAAFAYILGPISALLCLILETRNDYVRFHAYQSALLTTPLVLLRILGAIVHFPSFLNILITLWIIVVQACLALRAFLDASQNGLQRFYVPRVGQLAEQWVADE